MGNEVNPLLLLLSKRDSEWVAMARSLSGKNNTPLPLDLSRELVQDMYIALNKYVNDPEKIMYKPGEVNTMYIYITLRNLYYTYLKVNKKTAEKVIDFDTTEIIQETNSIEYHLSLSDLNEKVVEEINTWHHYDSKLFKLIFFKGISMRKLSQQTGISVTSIFNTVKKCKIKLREKFSTEYNTLFLN